MSSKLRHFVPFGQFKPDEPEFQASSLKKAKNVLPMFNALRPLRKLRAIGKESGEGQSSSHPAIGGMVHLTSQNEGLENLRPNADVQVGAWYEADGEGQDDLFDKVGELGVNHETRVYSHAEATDPADHFKVELSVPSEVPTVTTGHVVKVGYWVHNTTGPWTLRVKVANASDSFTFDITGTTPMAAPEVYEHECSTAEVTDVLALNDYADLTVEWQIITMTANETNPTFLPYADISGSGWKNEDDDEVGLYASIDEWPVIDVGTGNDPTNWDDDDYIVCPDLEPQESSEYGCYVGVSEQVASQYLLGIDDPVLTYRVKADQDDMKLTVTLKQLVSGSEVTLASQEHDPLEKTITNHTLTLDSSTNIDEIDWRYPVQLYFKFENTAAEGTETTDDVDGIYPLTQTLTIASCRRNLSFVNQAGSSALSAISGAIDEGASYNETDYITPVSGVPSAVFVPLTDYVTAADLRLARVYIRCSGDADSNIRVYLQDNAGFAKGAQSNVTDLTETPETVQLAVWLSGNQVPASGLELRIDAIDDSSFKIYSVWVSLERDTDEDTSPVGTSTPLVSGSGYVYGVYSLGPRNSSVAVTWGLIEAPSPKDYIPGDIVKVYCGTKTRLYEVNADTGAFDDVSWCPTTPGTHEDYGAENDEDEPKLWRFTAWGDWIIATNYVDPVQVLKPGDTYFSNLMVDKENPFTKLPRAKHVAVVGSQLAIADVNPNVWGDGKMFTFWVSATGDPEAFYEANQDKQSAFFQIVRSMGQITHLTGGEWGLLAKRGSLWRATYEGLPRIWRFDQVSRSIGCPYPNSMVSDGNNVFFVGHRRIYAVVDGQQLIPISTDTVERFFFDPSEGDSTVASQEPREENKNDATIVGTRDPYSGLIWWFYRDESLRDEVDGEYVMRRWICFNQVTNQWAHGYDSEADVTFACERPNIVSSETALTRGIYAFQFLSDTIYLSRFDDDYSYQGELQTKIIPAYDFPKVEQGQDIRITAIRPIFKMQEDVGTAQSLPELELTVRGSQDPQMLRDLQSRSVTFGQKETDPVDSWVHIEPLVGEFFDFEVVLPSFNFSEENMREFYGMQVLYSADGDV